MILILAKNDKNDIRFDINRTVTDMNGVTFSILGPALSGSCLNSIISQKFNHSVCVGINAYGYDVT